MLHKFFKLVDYQKEKERESYLALSKAKSFLKSKADITSIKVRLFRFILGTYLPYESAITFASQYHIFNELIPLFSHHLKGATDPSLLPKDTSMAPMFQVPSLLT